jgi:hypothetical protein
MQEIAFRNVVALPDGRFNCEIDHPNFGWIPFTADPNDTEPHGRAIWQAIKDAQPAGKEG